MIKRLFVEILSVIFFICYLAVVLGLSIIYIGGEDDYQTAGLGTVVLFRVMLLICVGSVSWAVFKFIMYGYFRSRFSLFLITLKVFIITIAISISLLVLMWWWS